MLGRVVFGVDVSVPGVTPGRRHGIVNLLEHPEAVVGELALETEPADHHFGGAIYPAEDLPRALPVILLIDAEHVDPQTQRRLALQLGVGQDGGHMSQEVQQPARPPLLRAALGSLGPGQVLDRRKEDRADVSQGLGKMSGDGDRYAVDDYLLRLRRVAIQRG